MATSQQIATRALRRLRVIAAEQTPAAADMAAATEALDAMIASWEAGALSGDVLPLDSRFEQGIIAMLAVRLAGDYGRTPDPILMRDADEGKRALDGAFFAVPAQRFESALIHTGQDVNSQYLLGQASDDNYATWAASTDYLVRQHVSYLGNVYECTTAGTSGTTGPTGAGTDIADGTATWCFRRVDGA